MNQALLVRDVNLNFPSVNGGIPAEVHLQNVGSKAISAYECSVVVTFDDGSQKATTWTEDVLGDLAASRAVARTAGVTRSGHRGDLVAGGTRSATVFIALSSGGARPVAATGKIEMLIYEDGTAIGDPAQVRVVLAGRKQRSADMAAAIADLRTILADDDMKTAAASPDTTEPNGTRRRALCLRIADRIAQAKLSASGVGEARELQTFLDHLSGGGFITASALTKGNDWMFENYQILQSALAAGSNAKVTQ